MIMNMQALVLNRYNGPLELTEISMPQPAHGQVRVRIAASGLNPLDTKIRAGSAAHAKHPLPLVLGIDMAGVVDAVGPGVTAFKIGDEVYGMTGGVGGIQGSLAQYAAVDADLLAIKPANLSMREAAALPLAFITSYSGIVDRAHLQPGQTVLVQGGAGGVGHISVQLARCTCRIRFTGPPALMSERVPARYYIGGTPLSTTGYICSIYIVRSSLLSK